MGFPLHTNGLSAGSYLNSAICANALPTCIKITLNRQKLFKDLPPQIMRLSAFELDRQLYVIFRGEEGLDLRRSSQVSKSIKIYSMLCYCGVTQELSDILQNTLQGMVPTPVTKSAKSHPLFVPDLELANKSNQPTAFKSTRRRTSIQITCAISSSSPADSSQWYEIFFFFRYGNFLHNCRNETVYFLF